MLIAGKHFLFKKSGATSLKQTGEHKIFKNMLCAKKVNNAEICCNPIEPYRRPAAVLVFLLWL